MMTQQVRTTVDVSVIIPTFNHTIEIQNAINSVLAQTVLPIELIVVDDASEQPVSQVIAGIIDHGPAGLNIIVKRHDNNAGAATARNTGIAEATAEFLAFLDADDTWMPDKLERQLPGLQQAMDLNGATIASVTGFDLRGSYTLSTQPERLGLVPTPARNLDDFASGCWFCPGSTLMVHRSFFNIVGLYDDALRRFEDYELFLRAGQKGSRLDVCHEILATINSTPSANERLPEPSMQSIYDRHSTTMQTQNPDAFNRMKAYFALEIAATRYRQKRHMASVFELMKSQWYHPRLSLHVIQRW